MPELTVAAETVAFLIEKTREFDAKEGATDPDSGSNAARSLLGEPLVSDYLAEGLNAFGIDWANAVPD